MLSVGVGSVSQTHTQKRREKGGSCCRKEYGGGGGGRVLKLHRKRSMYEYVCVRQVLL
jgi:hypothetical protein